MDVKGQLSPISCCLCGLFHFPDDLPFMSIYRALGSLSQCLLHNTSSQNDCEKGISCPVNPSFFRSRVPYFFVTSKIRCMFINTPASSHIIGEDRSRVRPLSHPARKGTLNLGLGVSCCASRSSPDRRWIAPVTHKNVVYTPTFTEMCACFSNKKRGAPVCHCKQPGVCLCKPQRPTWLLNRTNEMLPLNR